MLTLVLYSLSTIFFSEILLHQSCCGNGENNLGQRNEELLPADALLNSHSRMLEPSAPPTRKPYTKHVKQKNIFDHFSLRERFELKANSCIQENEKEN